VTIATFLAVAAYADSVIVGGKEFNLNIPFCGT
jgi:hypothetical protein